MSGGSPRRWIRAPLLHFLAGGGVLFLLVHVWPGRSPAGRAPEAIVLSSGDVAALAAAYTRETGLAARPVDEAALVDDAIDEELLVREARRRGLDRDRSIRNWLVEQMRVLDPGGPGDDESRYQRALALGLDRSDLVVRRILVHKMRLLAARLDERPPTDAALRRYFAAHAGDYRTPDRITFQHVFVAGSDPDAATRSTALLRVVSRRSLEPSDAAGLGDPFVTGPRVRGWSPAQVAKAFGPAFAARVVELPEGAWSGPIASPYGTHFVWVEARTAGEVAPFETVRGRVRERWLDETRARRLGRLLRTLRSETPVRIASASWQERRGS